MTRLTRLVCTIDMHVDADKADEIAAELRRTGRDAVATHHLGWSGPSEVEVRSEDTR